MKKIVSLVLTAAMLLAILAGCASTGNTDSTTSATGESTEPVASYTGTLEELIEAVYGIHSVEFGVASIPVDLTDTSEDGLWALKSYTGLDNADMITEAVASEAMIGAIAYSMVVVRVADPANAKTVAEAMKNNIDQRKWVCVEADDLLVAGRGDVVMLVMISTENGTAQPFVDAFSQVVGGTDFVLE